MGVPQALGAGKSDRLYLGQSTVAGLPDPTTIPAGHYYEMTDAGTAYSITWAAGDRAISNNTSWDKMVVGVRQVEDGGTGAATKEQARVNLDLLSIDEINDLALTMVPTNGLYLRDGNYAITPTIFTGNELLDGITFHVIVKFGARPDADNATVVALLNTLGGAGAAACPGLRVNTDDTVDMVFWDGSSADAYANDIITNVDYSKEYHITSVVDYAGSGNHIVSVDGKQVASLAISNAPSYLTAQKLQIGSNNTGSGQEVYGVWICNRVQTAAEILEFSKHRRVLPPDQWGAATELVTNGEFTSGVSNWTATNATMTQVTGTVDPGTVSPGADDGIMKLVDAGASARATQGITCEVGQRYRTTGYYYNKSANGGSGAQFAISASEASLSGAGAVIFAVDDVWTYFSIEWIATASTMYLGLWTDATTGDTSYIDGIETRPTGVVVAMEPENILPSGNWNGLANGVHAASTGAVPIKRPTAGQFTEEIELAHDSISTSAATTTLLTLPPGCRVVSIETVIDTAFDAATTLDVGIGGDGDKYAAAIDVDDVARRFNASSNPSESDSTNTTLYVQKSGATTQGNAKIRVTYEITAPNI